MKTTWPQRTKCEKILFILQIAASNGALVCALLQLTGIWDRAINAAVPLMGLSLLFQSVQEWKQNRKTAILGLCAALFIFVCAVAAFCGL